MRVHGDPQWAKRRQVIHWSLWACLGLSLLSIVRDDGTGGLANAVMWPVASTAGAIIGSYCFSAAWERVRGVPSQNYIEDDTAGGNTWRRW